MHIRHLCAIVFMGAGIGAIIMSIISLFGHEANRFTVLCFFIIFAFLSVAIGLLILERKREQ